MSPARRIRHRRRRIRSHRGRTAARLRGARRRRDREGSRGDCRRDLRRPGPCERVLRATRGAARADGYQAFIFGLPDSGLGDIADAAHALNTFADGCTAQTGSAKVDLIGHSQGGMVSRYYIKYLGGATRSTAW